MGRFGRRRRRGRRRAGRRRRRRAGRRADRVHRRAGRRRRQEDRSHQGSARDHRLSASRKPRTWSKARPRPSRKASPRKRPRRSRPLWRRPAPRSSSSKSVRPRCGPRQRRSRTVPGFGPGPFSRFERVRVLLSPAGLGPVVRAASRSRRDEEFGPGPVASAARRRRSERGERGRRPAASKIEERHGADIHRPQACSQGLRPRQGSRRNAEPDRSAEGLLRPIPA